MEELEVLDSIGEIEQKIALSDSKTQQRLLITAIRHMRTSLDNLYDQEYLEQLQRDPTLRGKVFPRLSTRNGG